MGPGLPLEDVAAAQAPQLDVNPTEVRGAEAPATARWVLAQHDAVHFADSGREGVEVRGGVTFQSSCVASGRVETDGAWRGVSQASIDLPPDANLEPPHPGWGKLSVQRLNLTPRLNAISLTLPLLGDLMIDEGSYWAGKSTPRACPRPCE